MSLWPFSKPTCPIDPERRDWIHERMFWLADQFGIDRWKSAPAIEPLAKFLPDPFNKDEASVRLMLDRVCRYMEVDPDRVSLEFHHVGGKPGITHYSGQAPAGLYHADATGKFVISLSDNQLDDPTPLVATIAHELAHARILGEDRVTGNEEDHEPLTDLATVFFGLGIFNANSVARFGQWSRGNWSGWQSSRLGYLDEPTFGYALGLWAFRRNELKPKWMRHLRPDPKHIMKKTIAYLRTNPIIPIL